MLDWMEIIFSQSISLHSPQLFDSSFSTIYRLTHHSSIYFQWIWKFHFEEATLNIGLNIFLVPTKSWVFKFSLYKILMVIFSSIISGGSWVFLLGCQIFMKCILNHFKKANKTMSWCSGSVSWIYHWGRRFNIGGARTHACWETRRTYPPEQPRIMWNNKHNMVFIEKLGVAVTLVGLQRDLFLSIIL